MREIRESRPDYLLEAFTVAEIYQNLVPYRSHRDVIGVEMNGDYEDALLRLLAGEGDYLFLESDVARREIRDELQTNNPNTGLFRDFAAADVRLNPAKIDSEGPVLYEEAEGVVEAEDDPEDAPEDAPEDDLGMVLGIAEADDVGVEEDDEAADDAPVLEDADASTSAVPDSAAPSCQWCKAELPEREGVIFCPFCGSNLRVVPCGECGEEIEPQWRFCVACGTEIPA